MHPKILIAWLADYFESVSIMLCLQKGKLATFRIYPKLRKIITDRHWFEAFYCANLQPNPD